MKLLSGRDRTRGPWLRDASKATFQSATESLDGLICVECRALPTEVLMMLKLATFVLTFVMATGPALPAPAGSADAARALLGRWHLTESHPYPATPNVQCDITDILFELESWSYTENGVHRGDGIYLYRKAAGDSVEVMTHRDIDGYTILSKDKIKYRGAFHYCIYSRVN
jgi:hypothetical protein